MLSLLIVFLIVQEERQKDATVSRAFNLHIHSEVEPDQGWEPF